VETDSDTWNVMLSCGWQDIAGNGLQTHHPRNDTMHSKPYAAPWHTVFWSACFCSALRALVTAGHAPMCHSG